MYLRHSRYLRPFAFFALSLSCFRRGRPARTSLSAGGAYVSADGVKPGHDGLVLSSPYESAARHLLISRSWASTTSGVMSKAANGCGPGLGSFTPSSLDPASLFSFSSSSVHISGCDRGAAGGRAWR